MKRLTKYAGVALIVLGVLAPFIPILIWSFARRWYFPAVLPTEWSIRGWAYAFSSASRLPQALWQSLLISGVTSLLSILIGLPAGRALGLHKFRGKTLVEFLMLAPTIVPAFAVAMGIHVVFIRLGLADTMIGVILVHLVPTLPYVTLVLAGMFANYDVNYEAQARSLGATPLQTIWYVLLPSIYPGLIVAGMFAFIISWSQYILTLLIGGGRVLTLPLLLFSFASSGDNNVTAALSIIFIAPAIVLLIISARYLTGRNVSLARGN